MEIDEIVGEEKPPKRTRKAKGTRKTKYVEDDDDDDERSEEDFHSGTDGEDDFEDDGDDGDNIDEEPPQGDDFSDGQQEYEEPDVEDPPQRSQQQQNAKRQLDTGVKGTVGSKAAKVVSGLRPGGKENKGRRPGQPEDFEAAASEVRHEISDLISLGEAPLGTVNRTLAKNRLTMGRR